MRPSVVNSAITEYREDNFEFLDHLSKTNEVFIVVDNSGWYYAINNLKATPEAATADQDVYFTI